MAVHQSSAVFHLEFQQASNSFFDRQIARVDSVLARAGVPVSGLLSPCQNAIPMTYSGDRYLECDAPATVFDLETELEYCAECFREVTR